MTVQLSPLAAMLLQEPDSLQARLVYADWLQSRGDPRGELVALQLHLAEGRHDAVLVERERTLRTALEAELLAGCPPQSLTLEWHLGLVRALRGHARHWAGLAPALAHLLADPLLLLLEELDMVHSWPTEAAAQAALVTRLGATLPRRLRSLGLRIVGDEHDALRLGDRLGELTALEDLTVHLSAGHLSAPLLDWLAGLDLHAFDLFADPPLGRDGVRAILELGWPKLTRLVLQLNERDLSLDRRVRVADLDPVLERRVFPGLNILGILATGQTLTEQLLARLPRTPLFQGLRALGVSFNERTHRQLESLADSYRSLELFDAAPDRTAASHHFRGRVLERFERSGEALEEHRTAVGKLPVGHTDRWRYLRQVGTSALAACRWEEALAAFDESLALAPDRFWTWSRRGRTLRALGRLDEALASFQASLQRREDGETAAFCQYQIGLIHAQRNELRRALAALQRARALTDETYVLFGLARVLGRLNRIDEVLPAVERTLSSASLSGFRRARLAWVLLQAGRAEAAESQFRRSLEGQPPADTSSFALAGLAAALRSLGREPEALACYDRLLLELDCPPELALTLLAKGCLLLDRQPAAARALFEQASAGEAVEPEAIVAALTAHGASRPAGATPIHGRLGDVEIWQFDLSWGSALALLAALLVGDRPLARRRLEALAAFMRPGHLLYYEAWEPALDLAQLASVNLGRGDRTWARTVVQVVASQAPRSKLERLLQRD